MSSAHRVSRARARKRIRQLKALLEDDEWQFGTGRDFPARTAVEEIEAYLQAQLRTNTIARQSE